MSKGVITGSYICGDCGCKFREPWLSAEWYRYGDWWHKELYPKCPNCHSENFEFEVVQPSDEEEDE